MVKIKSIGNRCLFPCGWRRCQMMWICACGSGQAQIVTIPPPSRAHLVPAVGSFGKCLNRYPGFHRWHLHCRDPSLTHKKKGKGETVKQMHWLLPTGEHLEDWPFGYLWNDGFSFITRTGKELSGNAEAKKEASIFGIVSKSLVLTVLNVTWIVYAPLEIEI